jgi:hypothetical protein
MESASKLTHYRHTAWNSATQVPGVKSVVLTHAIHPQEH